mmetsp:Transcript_18194/g.50957  ORF Transcript_18194/g.50957 Transcript_18194/m.50957 type:complete len:268 (+) Transcript_18194:1408-2211(+)|eukprot:1160714-Pelagomonas_calceolata.AAC.19
MVGLAVELLQHDLHMLGQVLAGLQGIQDGPHDTAVGACVVHAGQAVQGALHMQVLGGTVLEGQLLHGVRDLGDVGGREQLLGKRAVRIHDLHALLRQGRDEVVRVVHLRKGHRPAPVRALRPVYQQVRQHHHPAQLEGQDGAGHDGQALLRHAVAHAEGQELLVADVKHLLAARTPLPRHPRLQARLCAAEQQQHGQRRDAACTSQQEPSQQAQHQPLPPAPLAHAGPHHLLVEPGKHTAVCACTATAVADVYPGRSRGGEGGLGVA